VNTFLNGHRFALAVKRCPPSGSLVPLVEVEMAGRNPAFLPVIGKVDTGAVRTFLDFTTAKTLGIDDPTTGYKSQGKARTATDEEFDYFVHTVLVRIADTGSPGVMFPLDAAVAAKVNRNLFGADWLRNVCLAFDSAAVHFLKG